MATLPGFLENIVYRYFLVEGYNWVNTLTYALILGFVVFRFLPYLERLGFRINRRFGVSLTPYLFFAASSRALVDEALGWFGTLPPYPGNWFFVTPGLYLTMFTFTVSLLAISLRISQVMGGKYHNIFALLGLPFAAYNLYFILLNVNHPQYLAYVLASLTAVSLATAALAWMLKLGYLKNELNYVVVLAHLFDASTTFIGVDYAGYVEKHVVPTIFIDYLGTAAVMYPLKLLVLLPALYYVDKEMPAQEDEFERRLLKLTIFILGAAPGIRNLVLLVLG